jgi:hypothetical protein
MTGPVNEPLSEPLRAPHLMRFGYPRTVDCLLLRAWT